MLNNYFATQCIGSGVEIINVNLLTGGTSNAFLGSDGICWYVTTNPTVSAATITPLLEFGIYSGTGCSDCATQGCVNWEVSGGTGGATINLQGCCGDLGKNSENIPEGNILNICSKIEPVVVSGLANIVNQGFCPSC